MGKNDQEATLKEVLAEVSVLDVWTFFKSTGALLGCMGIIIVIATMSGAMIDATEFGVEVPEWIFWLVLVWFLLAISTSENSYHSQNISYYFPKLGWIGSLPFAAYLIFIVQFAQMVKSTDELYLKLFFFVLFLLLLAPLPIGIGLMQIGHERLMKKRDEIIKSGEQG